MTVLVTGGAGYIGSHMVHELADAGEPVVVLDNLSTGFRFLIPASVPFIAGSTGDRPLVGGNHYSSSRQRDYPLRGIDRRSGIGFRSARILQQQYDEYLRPA